MDRETPGSNSPKYVVTLLILTEPHRWCVVRALTQSVIDCGFKPRSRQTKDYIICICYFSAKHAVLRRKSKDWVA